MVRFVLKQRICLKILELIVKIFDKEGEELWRKSIKSSDLK